ncbi:STM4015 family protein [Actinomadura sp. WAC 06369]|uniref:STM4015 family protein n=1 Tax=Actinomadura sp. WAC 06369 TaxID=2203193 RepID=UPI0018F57F18|nr:STM4015 family protein [Actinomadura sp. WAC 06369]
MIVHHLDEYAGLPVERFGGRDAAGAPASSAGRAAWRVAVDGGEEFGDAWARFRRAVDTTQVRALVIASWGRERIRRLYPVPWIAEAAADLPNLRSLFLGDITVDEAEMSWIKHADVTPLLRAFPKLERLDVRGSDGLVLEPVEHAGLRTLRFESGGLPASVVRAVGASELPNLERLDLWLGEDYYGGDATPADLAPILAGERLPSLRHLGLEDSEIQDEIAEAVASAPVVARLESLSLAMGVLTDRGAEALLAGQPLTHLRKLDLHHHFLSEDMMRRVAEALPGAEVDLRDRREPDEGDEEPEFYVAVSE